jgi:hypothetical protein
MSNCPLPNEHGRLQRRCQVQIRSADVPLSPIACHSAGAGRRAPRILATAAALRRFPRGANDAGYRRVPQRESAWTDFDTTLFERLSPLTAVRPTLSRREAPAILFDGTYAAGDVAPLAEALGAAWHARQPSAACVNRGTGSATSCTSQRGSSRHRGSLPLRPVDGDRLSRR